MAGAGASAGGTVTFDAPPAAGTILTLRRVLHVARTTDFADNGILRARTLNDELDFQVAALQDVQDAVGDALHLDPAEVGGRTALPLRAARPNRVLGFDDVGDVTVFDRGETTLRGPFSGAIPRTVSDKLGEHLSARDFGATGDGATDDAPALQSAMNAAAATGKHLEIGEGIFVSSQPLSLAGAAAGLTMRGTIRYAGPAGTAALTLGDGGATKNAQKLYQGIRVLRATQSDWSNEADIGVVVQNLDSSVVDIRQAEGFTIGIRSQGDGRGIADTTFYLGRIVNNRIGLDVRTLSAAAWNTSNRYHGGLFAHSSALFPTQDRFGVRLSAAPGAYVAHNRHIFDGANFSMFGRDRPISAIPFLIEVNSRAVIARNIRMEGCSPFVARHTGAAQDHLYEIAWASQGYMLDVDYTATATRVGSVVRATHQAMAHRESVREVASVPSLRAAAIRWSSTETGFDKLACLSTNVAGTPSTLTDFAFPALPGYQLNNRGVVLPGGRGLGFVVDTRRCREFALAVDADVPRLIVQCFDRNAALLTDAAGPLVRASGQTMLFNAGTRWWQGSTDMLDSGLTRLQTVRLDPQVMFAIIGIARVDADYEVRALRLACDPAQSPAVLYGLPDLPLGRRQLVVEAPWTPPTIAGGATAQLNVPVTGARPGDFVTAAYSFATSGVLFLAQVGATDVITVTAWNRSGGDVTLNPGTVRVQLVKG